MAKVRAEQKITIKLSANEAHALYQTLDKVVSDTFREIPVEDIPKDWILRDLYIGLLRM